MPLLATKLKNQVKRLNPNCQPRKLGTITVNESKKGCSGFFINPESGQTVYVNTEESCYQPFAGKALVRYAKNDVDYTGGRNVFVPVDRTAEAIVEMLTNDRETHNPLKLETTMI